MPTCRAGGGHASLCPPYGSTQSQTRAAALRAASAGRAATARCSLPSARNLGARDARRWRCPAPSRAGGRCDRARESNRRDCRRGSGGRRRSRRQFDEPVVAAVGWILAPAIVGANGAHRKYRPRPHHTIGAIEHLANGKASKRCRAVAFPLQRLDAAPAKRRTPHAMRQDKAPFPWISGCAPQRDVSLNSHGQLAFFLLGEANRPACPMGRPPLLLETSEFTRGQPWAMRARS